MNVISTTVEYKGNAVKIENGRVFVRAFGTTIYRQNTPHWTWQEVPKDKMKDDFRRFLIENKLI